MRVTKTAAARRFDGLVKRMHQSANSIERNSTYWGYTVDEEYPVLIPDELLFEHVHILGGTGTGKSALGLSPLTVQLIRQGNGPVLVLDLKGDMALFNTARIEAEAAGRKFKWFTNKPNRSTYVFNPWRQAYLEGMTLQEVLGLFLLSLNMHHGDDYGRAFFGMNDRSLFQNAVKDSLALERATQRRSQRRDAQAPQSFVELEEYVREQAQNNPEFRGGQHLLHVLQSLIDFPQLNMSPTRDAPSAAMEHAIHMPDVVREKQVVYFWLQGVMDLTTVAELARLGLYSVLTAALAHREETGEKPKVYVIADEAQNLVAQNIANVLAQAREHGVACVLAHQSMSQLNPPGGVDLRELVSNCTSIKQFWSARDPMLKDHISKISGEVLYYSASWEQKAGNVQQGDIGRQFATAKPDEPAVINIGEVTGPRLTSQDIEDHSRSGNVSIMSVERNAGLCCFQGAFPVHMDWIMSKEEYDRRNLAMGWPAPSEETIVTEGIWPKMSDATVPPTASDTSGTFTVDALEGIRRSKSRESS